MRHAPLSGFGTLNDGGGTNVLYGNYGAPDPNYQGTGTLYDHGGINDVYNGSLYANGGSHNTVHNTGALYSTTGTTIVGNGSGYNVGGPVNIDSDSDNNQTLSAGSDRFVGAELPITVNDWSGAGSPSIVKTGVGSSILGGQSLYTGDTLINAGTLALNSDASLGDTAIRVNSGGTFAPHPDVGIGTISAGGTGSGAGDGASLWLSGGAYDMTDGAIGTFQLNQNYGFTGPALSLYNSTLKFDLNNTGADQLITGGSANIGGTNTISITGLGTNLTLGSSFNLITASAGGLSPLYGTLVFSNGTPVENLTLGGHSYALERKKGTFYFSLTGNGSGR